MLSKSRVIQLVVDKLPKVANTVVPRVPRPVSKVVIEQTLNRFFKADLLAGDLDFMRAKTMQVTLTDLAFCFYVTGIDKSGTLALQVSHQAEQVDVAMAGNVDDLFLLTTQQVDPDTLFFRRRLSLRGDTELGLEIKNFLDTVELESRLPPSAYRASLDIANVLIERQPHSSH
ncbi:SCP2 domain-containing protein [Aliidiomarina taiwanensis]|uniref:SCP2 domain-containing protein n=1 Tax=Aliidiomarina taiwanensis TaxID=946228 RepID=A0A432X7B0_9GAMM|nr:SCP2 sterol-binding domain-containing protein [Aliidiomarina taiwanensis]RUO42743.1 SCP2 domain-containing protein [Aliidiomarina taiwanensis]